MDTNILNLFEAPTGAIRNIPSIREPEFRLRYSQIGAFRRHEYDLDICTIYRQMDDLKVQYQVFAGKPYAAYVQQIKENVLRDLERLKLDADFYLDHFYCALQPTDVAYRSYLALFLSLGDYLKLIPLLEHHLKEFVCNDNEGRGADGFLDLIEFQVCAFLRSNRFPEDWFAKHDKILNWVYAKRGRIENEKQQQEMMQRLIDAVNKTTKAAIPTEILQKRPNEKTEQLVKLIDERVEVLFEDIKVYFSEESHEPLKRILKGEGQPNEKVIFKGQANQLIDVFRIYCEDKYISGTKRAVGRFIVEHFMTFSDTDTIPQRIGTNVENVIYNEGLPPKGKRIPLSGLKKVTSHYYPKNTT